MNFTDISVTFNRKYLSNITTWIEDGAVNIEMTTITNLDYGMRGNIAIQVRIENSAKYQTLFSYEVDVCKMLTEMFGEHLLRNWFRNLLKHANLMENCPVVPVSTDRTHIVLPSPICKLF